MASARNSPTPTATVIISTMFGTDGTCPARTCRSGSDTVMMTPMRNPVSRTVSSFFILEICTPTPSPSGVIAISAPSWKKPMPTISIRAPVRNMTTLPSSIGIRKMLSIRTIPVIGSTAESDSLIFSFSFTFNSTPTFQQRVVFCTVPSGAPHSPKSTPFCIFACSRKYHYLRNHRLCIHRRWNRCSRISYCLCLHFEIFSSMSKISIYIFVNRICYVSSHTSLNNII